MHQCERLRIDAIEHVFPGPDVIAIRRVGALFAERAERIRVRARKRVRTPPHLLRIPIKALADVLECRGIGAGDDAALVVNAVAVLPRPVRIDDRGGGRVCAADNSVGLPDCFGVLRQPGVHDGERRRVGSRQFHDPEPAGADPLEIHLVLVLRVFLAHRDKTRRVHVLAKCERVSDGSREWFDVVLPRLIDALALEKYVSVVPSVSVPDGGALGVASGEYERQKQSSDIAESHGAVAISSVPRFVEPLPASSSRRSSAPLPRRGAHRPPSRRRSR